MLTLVPSLPFPSLAALLHHATQLQGFASSASASRDMARMTLIGRLGGVPEKKTTKTGKDFLIYKVATSDPFVAPKEGGESRPTSGGRRRSELGSGRRACGRTIADRVTLR